MRKRPSRPPRFVAIDNGAADDTNLHVLALGLLALLLRAKDGDEVNVESLSKKRKEGREALSGAMRNLVENAYVVKLKIHGQDGKWRTEFSVDSVPFTPEDVATMLAEAFAEGARAVRVEPQWLDPRDAEEPERNQAPRPTGSRMSVVTSGNDGKDLVGTTNGFPAVGSTGVGSSAANKRKKTVKKDSLPAAPPASPTPAASTLPERETGQAFPQDQLPMLTPLPSARTSSSEATEVAEAWIRSRRAHGHQVTSAMKRKIAEAAQLLLTDPEHPADLGRLCAAAEDMGKVAHWTDLVLHFSKCTLPGQRSSLPEWCGECNRGERPHSVAQRLRELPDGTDVKCPACHPHQTHEAV